MAKLSVTCRWTLTEVGRWPRSPLVGNSGKRDIALSELLLGRADGLLTDIIGVFAAIGFCVAARLILNMIAPGLVPFALTFPAVMVATLFAGARAGITATVTLQ